MDSLVRLLIEIIAAVSTIAGFIFWLGKLSQRVKDMETDVTKAHELIRDLEGENKGFGIDLAEIKRDVKHILEYIKEDKTKP